MTVTVHKDFARFPVQVDLGDLQFGRGELPDIAELIALQDSLESIPGRPSPIARTFGAFIVIGVLAACGRIDKSHPTSDVKPVGTPTSIGPDVSPTTTLGPAETLVVPPGTPVVELPSQQEFNNVSDQALPPWIAGELPSIDPAVDLEPSPWDGARYATVRQHGLVPVLEGGVVANYRADNGLVYAPILAQISSEDGTVLFASGEIQPGGIMAYVSAGGTVKRYMRAGIACPDMTDCLQVVSYNIEDAGGLYWGGVDQNTGEITSFSPAITEDKPGRAEWLPVGDRWSSALSGSTALQAAEAYGIDYQRSVDGATNIFYFAAGDKQYQAKDREIFYTPTDKRLWVENESGIFLFDNTTHEWTRVADKGAEMIGVGDKQMIIAGEAWHTVESIDGSSGVQIVTTQDGQKWVWSDGEWISALPAYGEIDPNVADKLKAEGINIPDELKNPEYKLDLATNLQKTEWGNAYGLDIPITVIPENGIAYGKYHIKGIGATQEAWDEYAKQHIKYMWIHYREYGNEADRDITLEQYVELLRAGRGGFEIPQYNPETGFFDKKAMVNPLAGYVKVISDNTKDELPLGMNTEDSALFYVDENGMVWATRNDLEFSIVPNMDPNNDFYKKKPYIRGPNLASILIQGPAVLGLRSNFCLSTGTPVTSCAQEVSRVDKKYSDDVLGPTRALFKDWLDKYEKQRQKDAKPPVWLE